MKNTIDYSPAILDFSSVTVQNSILVAYLQTKNTVCHKAGKLENPWIARTGFLKSKQNSELTLSGKSI